MLADGWGIAARAMNRQTKPTRGKHRAGAHANGCRHGFHQFGKPASVGGGILRSVCDLCGDVSLDLRPAEEPRKASLFINVVDTRQAVHRRARSSRRGERV